MQFVERLHKSRPVNSLLNRETNPYLIGLRYFNHCTYTGILSSFENNPAKSINGSKMAGIAARAISRILKKEAAAIPIAFVYQSIKSGGLIYIPLPAKLEHIPVANIARYYLSALS